MTKDSDAGGRQFRGGRRMTNSMAFKLADEFEIIAERLRGEFPCGHCEGTGDDPSTAHDADGGGPCHQCWGRGWTITEGEGDE